MRSSHDTSGPAGLESAPRRPVFRVRAGQPAAEAAERIVARWREGWEGRPPACVLADDAVHSALVEHLLLRLRALPPGPGAVAPLAEALMMAVDAGATLVHGGRPAEDEGTWEPTLFLNVPPALPLLADPRLRGPVLCVARILGATDTARFLRAMSSPELIPLFQAGAA